MKKETLTCRTHCVKWNSIDKDCELYGENHLRPTNCISFWLQKIKVGRIFKQKNGEVFVISNSNGLYYYVIYKDGYTVTYNTDDDTPKSGILLGGIVGIAVYFVRVVRIYITSIVR